MLTDQNSAVSYPLINGHILCVEDVTTCWQTCVWSFSSSSMFVGSVVKVGVGVNDDAKRLTCDYNLVVRGCVDLRHVQQRICHVYQW